MKPFQCHCDAQFNTANDMVKHYRKCHPDDGYECWNRLGDIGDRLGNSALASRGEEVMKLRERCKDFDKLAASYNSLVRRLAVAIEILGGSRHDPTGGV